MIAKFIVAQDRVLSAGLFGSSTAWFCASPFVGLNGSRFLGFFCLQLLHVLFHLFAPGFRFLAVVGICNRAHLDNQLSQVVRIKPAGMPK